MPATPGTIADYDVVLSISEQAINKQFQSLYDYKLGDGQFRPAHAVTGGLPAAPAKYAINHEWKIQLDFYTDPDTNEPVFIPEAGIFAHLKCPNISLHGGSPQRATLTITFGRDETVPEFEGTDTALHTSPDSRYYYYGGPPGHEKLLHTNINGWQISWEVTLASQQVADVMNDLIKKHEDPNDPTFLPPGLQKGLQTVSSKVFTVAAIFCLMESDVFVNTFKMVDENGAQPSLDTMALFMNKINLYFRGLADAEKKAGVGGNHAPNPDNPFVLGYGITQDMQSMQQANPTASWKDTPAYFIPAYFHLTSTKGSQDGLSTLNYCMVTHTSKDPNQPPRKVDPTSDLDAGHIDQSFFDVTSTNFGDAMMAWSQDVFWNKWIVNTIIPNVWIDPSPILDHFVAARVEETTKMWNYLDKQSPDDSKPSNDGRRSWNRHVPFATNTIAQAGTTLYGSEMHITGHSNTDVVLKSDFSDSIAAGTPLAPDHARAVYLDIQMEFEIRAHFETYAHVINPPRYRAYEGAVTMRFHLVIKFEQGDGGVWEVSFSNPASERPDVTSIPGIILWGKPVYFVKVQDIGDSSPPANQYGAWSENHEYNNAHIFSPGDIQNQLKMALAGWTGTDLGAMIKSLNDVMGSLRQSIMMPGGEVFTFSGLDTNDSGQLFAHMNYAIGVDGVHPITN